MKRHASYSLNNQRTKRTRFIKDPSVSFDSLPIEVWTDHIISLYPKDWLGVSKEWHDRVIPILFQDPRIDKDAPDFCLAMIQLGHIQTIKLLLKYCRVDNSYFDTAIEHNQLEVLKILLRNEMHDEVIEKESSFVRVRDGCIKYGMVDILENIYSEFQFTTDAKKAILVKIVPYPKFGGLLQKVIQEPDIESSWIQEQVIYIARYGINSVMEWILTNDRIDLHDVYTSVLLLLVARSCNLEILLLLLKHSQKHFTNEDIKSALKASAEIGNLENFMYLFTNYNFSAKTIKGVISHACISGNVDLVTMLLNDPRVDPAEYNNLPLRDAVKLGHTDIVQLLLEDSRVDPRVNDDEILSTVVERKRLQILQLLLQSPKIKYENTIYYDLARYACKIGQPEILEYLIYVMNVDPTLDDNEMLFIAIENNRKDIVNLLLLDPRVDPSINDNEALEFAKMNKKNKIVEILLKDKRVNPES
jgi:ankyrin repeat protein